MRVLPTITNGEGRLILSESFVFDPSQALTISVPTSEGPNLDILFLFPDGNESAKNVTTKIGERKIEISVPNFLSYSTHAGNLQPLIIQLSNKSELDIRFMGATIKDMADSARRSTILTVSIYERMLK